MKICRDYVDNDYDVIIAGAGPAGTITARKCAEKGLKVLVLEKRAEIGSPKRCGEAISKHSLKLIGYTGDEPFVTQRITGATLYTPDNNSISLSAGDGKDDCGLILERKLYDKYLAYDAAKAGARIYAKADVYDLIRKDGKIAGVKVIYNGEKKEIHSKIVVAADGIESKIARIAGLKSGNTQKSIVSGYQYEMANISLDNPHDYYFYCGKDIAPRGYIWVFPKGDNIANVGIGIDAGNENTAKYYLDKWIESQPNIRKGSIIEENAGGVPVGGFLENMVTDNFLAVGDAAHQVNPLHGGGLAESFHSACIASEMIADAIGSGDTSMRKLDAYNRVWWKKRGNNLKKVEKVVRLYERLSDSELNYIISCIKTDDLNSICGGDISILVKILMKNPRLLTLARHLK